MLLGKGARNLAKPLVPLGNLGVIKQRVHNPGAFPNGTWWAQRGGAKGDPPREFWRLGLNPPFPGEGAGPNSLELLGQTAHPKKQGAQKFFHQRVITPGDSQGFTPHLRGSWAFTWLFTLGRFLGTKDSSGGNLLKGRWGHNVDLATLGVIWEPPLEGVYENLSLAGETNGGIECRRIPGMCVPLRREACEPTEKFLSPRQTRV